MSRSQAERNPLYASNKIYCFSKAENIKNYSISLKVRKNFECMDEVNEVIRQALEAGLITKWSNEGQILRYHDDLKSLKNNLIPKLSNALLLSIACISTVLTISAEMVMNNRIDELSHHNYMTFVDKIFRAQFLFRFSSEFETFW